MIKRLGEDYRMIKEIKTPIRVMRIIARMNVGGPAVQVSGLMRGFDQLDFEHRLFTGYCAEDESDYLDMVATDIRAYRIEGFGRRINFTGDLKALFALIVAIRSYKPHVIHTHTAKAGLLGRLASVLSMHPTIRVHTFHGHLLYGYFTPLKRRLIIIAEKFLAVHTHHLLAVGDKVRQDLLFEGIGRTEKFGLMPPGLEIDNLPNKQISRESYNLSTTKLQCAFIGRVTQIKRPDRFLDVVSKIMTNGVQIEFFIAGDGDLLEVCRERIERENLPVKVLGWQNNIAKVLAAADIVILTSDNEGTPLSLIQAGMAGLPVVTTRVGSVPEVVLDGRTGIITSSDVEEISDALLRLAHNPDLRAQMGAAAREFTLANFGVARLVRDHEHLYKKLMKKKDPGKSIPIIP